MKKERKKNKELVIIPLFVDRIMNCCSYFERSGLSNMITNNQYCLRLHLPIIMCITNKAVQAITNNKCNIDNVPEFEMLCKVCEIDDEQMITIKKSLQNLTLKLDYIGTLRGTMEKLLEYCEALK